jgi:hypothetical protein
MLCFCYHLQIAMSCSSILSFLFFSYLIVDVDGTDLLSIYCHIHKMILLLIGITFTIIHIDTIFFFSPVALTYRWRQLSLYRQSYRHTVALHVNTTHESNQRWCYASRKKEKWEIRKSNYLWSKMKNISAYSHSPLQHAHLIKKINVKKKAVLTLEFQKLL